MGLLGIILGLVITGVVFGYLGRLAIPGPNPMSVGTTILCGIGGAFLGSVVGLVVGARPENNVWVFFVLQVLGAALIVYLVSRRRGY